MHGLNNIIRKFSRSVLRDCLPLYMRTGKLAEATGAIIDKGNIEEARGRVIRITDRCQNYNLKALSWEIRPVFPDPVTFEIYIVVYACSLCFIAVKHAPQNHVSGKLKLPKIEIL